MRAVFLDRDGTLIEHVHYLSDPALVKLLPGAAEALTRFRRAGLARVLVTNQSAIGRGMLTVERLDQIIAYCSNDQGATSFLDLETAWLGLLRSLGCLLIQLLLRARHDRLDPTTWRARGYRVADPAAGRTLKTSCGPVAYARAFLVPRHGGGTGVHPLDVALGLTRDAYNSTCNSNDASRTP